MTSLVLELQRAAMDNAVGLVELLRKALAVAAKLDLADFKAWVEHELDGYKQNDPVPEYRQIHCEVQSRDPYTGRIVGWGFPNSEVQQQVTRRRIAEGVSVLEHLIANGEELILPLPPEIQRALMTNCDDPDPLVPFSSVQKSQLQGIVDGTRTTVLKWSLRLEREGILGEGMTFTQQEKEAASRDAPHLGPSINIVHVAQMSGSQIQQGTVSSTQVGSFSSLDLKAVSQMIQDLKARLPDLRLKDDERLAVESHIATIEAQASSPRPKIEVIRECLRSIRSVAEGTTGSMVAAGIIEAIAKLLGG